MSVRSWAVGVVSTAAVVVGVMGVQSGIAGTSALPVVPHRAGAGAVPDSGAELPAPAEVSTPPPSVGAVRTAPADRVAAVVVPERRAAPAAHRSEKHSGEGSDDNSGKGSKDHSGKDSGKNSDEKSGKD
jgi:hypothetical protein